MNEAVWESAKSTSVKAMLPVSVRFGVASSSVTAPIASVSAATIVTSSLTPVTVMVTSEVLLSTVPSLALYLNVTSAAVSPAAR